MLVDCWDGEVCGERQGLSLLNTGHRPTRIAALTPPPPDSNVNAP